MNIRVKSLSNLDRALTHTSFIKDSSEMTDSYERLEFLGDAILNASVADLLFEKYPDSMEGRLSMIRAALVDELTLSEVALKKGLTNFVKLGKGEKLENDRARRKVGADVVESLIATIYLDFGFKKTKEFIRELLEPHLNQRINDGGRDFKTRLQARSLAFYKEYPVYSVVAESGPDHNKEFEVSVNVSSHYSARAKGRSKKEAEQKAAKKILLEMDKNQTKG